MAIAAMATTIKMIFAAMGDGVLHFSGKSRV
jgi:hypothetical protein